MGNAIKHLLEFGPFRIDPEQRQLLRDQHPIPLSPKAFELLLVLAQRSGQVVLKDDLMSLLWPDTFVEESNLGQHVFQLRKALGEQAQDPSYIVTVPGRGYRFAPKIRIIPAPTDEEILLESHSRSRVVVEEESLSDSLPASRTKLRRILFVALSATAVLPLGMAWLVFSVSPPKVLRVRQITHSGRIEPYGKVISDGPRLYFVEKRGGKRALAQASATGGEPTLISTSVPSLMVHDIDLSKSRLLIGTSGTESLWVLPTQGGSARRLGDVFSSEAAAWSPDGRNVFYGHDARIYKVRDDGGEPAELLTAPGYITSLRMSPDGKLLRFTVRDPSSGGNSLWESAADGSNLHLLSFGWKVDAAHWGEGECCGDWTPDGSYFLFRTAHDGVESFWTIREKKTWLHKDSSAPVQLYASPDHIGQPRFSPDGKKIFFANYQERRELVRYDNVHKLFMPYLDGIPARLLSFSPDGKWVAYRNETDGSLWRSRLDGTEKLQLTFPPLAAYHSSWSPDGKKIVFGARLPGETSRLYSVSVEGGKADPLTPSDSLGSQPSWSPDGRSIAFEGWVSGESGVHHLAIYILDLSTRQTRFLSGSRAFDGVHWSPDGKYLAAADVANGGLVLFDFSRQRWSKLADGSPYGWGIRWSYDSRYVYYQNLDEGEEQPIFRVRVGDRAVEQITSARQILRADVLGYSMTGLTPDNSPLASLIHKNSDIYVLDLDLP